MTTNSAWSDARSVCAGRLGEKEGARGERNAIWESGRVRWREELSVLNIVVMRLHVRPVVVERERGERERERDFKKKKNE